MDNTGRQQMNWQDRMRYGISLRDAIAMQAMNALLVNYDAKSESEWLDIYSQLSKEAYFISDEMLQARKVRRQFGSNSYVSSDTEQRGDFETASVDGISKRYVPRNNRR